MKAASEMKRLSRPAVKICGQTRADDLWMCVRFGADIVGFVVDYPRPVPWNLDLQQASELIKSTPPSAKTCVVTGGATGKILSLARELRPDYLQLHYGETPEETAYLCGELRELGIRVIKALSPGLPDLEQAAVSFAATGVYALLLDPRTPDNAAHGAGTASFAVYKKVARAVSCPVFLAGGITSANVREAVRQTGAPLIDLMTGVESSPGVKDRAKVAALFAALADL